MTIDSNYTETEIEKAFEESRSKRMPVLVDFWSTGCKGCKKMDEVTYQQPAVLDYLSKYYVLVKYNTHNRHPSFRNAYITSPYLWTPTFIVFANDCSEVRKATGYLPPKQFLDEMEMGRAMAALRKAQSSEALAILKGVIETSDAESIIQEAYYWAGIAAFYANGKKLDPLVVYWEELMAEFPGSNWAERADCLNIVL